MVIVSATSARRLLDSTAKKCLAQREHLAVLREAMRRQQEAPLLARVESGGCVTGPARLKPPVQVSEVARSAVCRVHVEPTSEEVDGVARSLLNTVGEPCVRDADLSGLHAGLRLRQARRIKGWTQRGLARQLGISETYLQRIETGRCVPAIKTQARIYAWLLGHNLQNFFAFTLQRQRRRREEHDKRRDSRISI
jgi:DNA-binding XRE family transcriptional regulator